MNWSRIRPWNDRSEEAQRAEYSAQALAWEAREAAKEWLRIYVRMAKALVAEFGAEVVLDTLEKVWWDLQYEGGKSLRGDWDGDPHRTLATMFDRWHAQGPQSFTSGICDAVLEGDRWHVLQLYCKQKEVALELDAREIVISQCMGDCAAVRGWSPGLVMRFPNVQLRGDPYCYQIREVAAHDDPGDDQWSIEKSERWGWRSIQRLER
jgi:hypothetical protein